jgi:ferritin
MIIQVNQTEAEKLAQDIVDRMKDLDDRPSSQRVSEVSQRMNGLLSHLRQNQELRKWCVEKAAGDVELAQKIFQFVNLESQKVIDKIENSVSN